MRNILKVKNNFVFDMTPIDVLMTYGGMNFIYTISAMQGKAIVHWADDDEKILREMIFPIKDKTIEEIKNRTISLRDAYAGITPYIAERNLKGEYSFYNTQTKHIEEYLPDLHVFLP